MKQYSYDIVAINFSKYKASKYPDFIFACQNIDHKENYCTALYDNALQH